MTAKRTKSCGYVERANKALAPRNASLSVSISFTKGFVYPILALEKIDPKKRGDRPLLVPSYCPFCGVMYPRADVGVDAKKPRVARAVQ